MLVRPAFTHSLSFPSAARRTIRRLGLRPTRWALTVRVASQTMQLHEHSPAAGGHDGIGYEPRQRYVISTSSFGLGQVMNSNRTPLGLHRVARKVGAGQPIGTIFRSRQPIGLTWQGQPQASIVHRILWLEGVEPGFNRGGDVDTFNRFIYIHGFGDETTLGRPKSHGCIHVAAADLLPLFDRLPVGTLVWIAEH